MATATRKGPMAINFAHKANGINGESNLERDQKYDGDTALTLYFREISKVRLLTPKEEIILANRIKRGDKKAREQMITANLRLVVKIAKDHSGIGVPLLDLISEGNIGLMKGVERFDPSFGAKLSTYASWWIKQSIRKALAKQLRNIRLPIHMIDKIYTMRKVADRLQNELGREPTDDEIASAHGVSVTTVRFLLKSSQATVSLDKQVSSEDDQTLNDTISDENAMSPAEICLDQTQKNLLKRAVAKLSPREATVIRARFGLGNYQPESLEEVGKRFNRTRERIRQIEAMALERLKKIIQNYEKKGVLNGKVHVRTTKYPKTTFQKAIPDQHDS